MADEPIFTSGVTVAGSGLSLGCQPSLKEVCDGLALVLTESFNDPIKGL